MTYFLLSGYLRETILAYFPVFLHLDDVCENNTVYVAFINYIHWREDYL